MVALLEVIVKDEQRRLRRDFLIYEPFTMHENDDTISKCVKETVDEFKGEPDDIKLKASMVLK
jgi:hypothetical protein